MSEPRTPDDLQAYLDAYAIDATILHMDAATPTVPAAAEALGVAVDQIVKTVLFIVDGTPIAVLAGGVRWVDRKRLALHVSVSPKRVKLADGDEVQRWTGYAPGTVPPIGHPEPLRTIIDCSVGSQELIYAGGGGLHEMLKIPVAELRRAIPDAVEANVLEDTPAVAPTSALL